MGLMEGKRNHNIVSVKSRNPLATQTPDSRMWYLWVCIALSRSTPAFKLPYQNNIALHDNDNEEDDDDDDNDDDGVDDDDDDDLVKIYTCKYSSKK